MEGKVALGVDIGATWVRVAVSDTSGEILAKSKEAIRTSGELEVSSQVIKLVKELIAELNFQEGDIIGIGIASAGPMNRQKGELVTPSNIPLEVVPLAGPLKDEFNVEVELINDGVSAVLAESRYGAGQERENIVYITISTGIGGGVIMDGNLLLGKNGNAAEVGHFTIDEEEKLKCGCGRRGHWEAYCSGSNIPNFVEMKLNSLKFQRDNSSLLEIKEEGLGGFQAKDLFDLARDGDEHALELVEELGRLNAIGFATVTEAYDPELITIGGGVALNNPDLILTPIKSKIERYTQNEVPEIRITPLDENNVLYGAIARALSLV